jgi:putative two-component system response regulator
MMLAAAAEAHDRTTGMHLMSIRTLVESLARELGYDELRVAALGLAAVLHDIGKVSVPDAVLSSSGKLAGDEWEQMKHHTIWGGDFLSGRPGFDLAASVARWHHERWDGAGYPDGLRDGQIPEEASIVTVADSFDAMTHDRPYKAGRSMDLAIEEIKACSGTQFNPRVVEALVRLYERGDLVVAEDDDDHGHVHGEPLAA